MNATVTREELLKAINAVKPYTAGRSTTLEILQGIKITEQAGQLLAESTDLEAYAAVSINGYTAADRGFSSVVNAKDLLAVVRGRSKGETLSLESSDGHLTIQAGGSSRSLVGFQIADFPETPGALEGTTVTFSAVDVETIRRVAVAVSTDEARPVLSGLLFAGDKVVATDSYRLAVGTITSLGDIKIIVPGRIIKQILKGKPESLKMTVRGEENNSQSRVSFTYGAVTVTSRLIDGDFPNWAQLVPAEFKTTLRADVAELAGAVKAFGKIPGNTPVKIRFDRSDVSVSWNEAGEGGGSAELHNVSYSGDLDAEPGTIAFNPRFLVDALENGGGRIQINDASKPALFGDGLEGNGGPVQHLLMPVRMPS